MKLFSLRLTTLKSKLYAIVFASFVIRVVGLLTLPNSSTVLAPDEGAYAYLAGDVAAGTPVNQSPYGGEGLYLISRAFLIPASVLIRLGISGFDSVRIISSLYGFLTLTLLTFLFIRLANSQVELSNWVQKNPKKVIFLFTIFALSPSHLIWSMLALRESTLEFWVLFVFILVFYIFEVRKNPSKLAITGILVGILLVFSSRPQVGWVVGVSLLTFFFIKIRIRAAQILIPITLIGVILGFIMTSSQAIQQTEGSVTQTETVYIKELKNPGTAFIDQTDAILSRHEGNKVGAASAIKTTSCPNSGSSRFDKYFCITYRAPYTTFTFLFRPIFGSDVTSLSSLAAAIENVFWLSAFLFMVIMYIRNRRLAFLGALIPSLLFFSFYSVGAGAYEGNMGTAFRHKSLILWVVLLLLASTIVATQQRKAQRQGISGSSQE